jgi:hypothetical protein
MKWFLKFWIILEMEKKSNHTKGLWKNCILYMVYSNVGLVCRVLVRMHPCMHLRIWNYNQLVSFYEKLKKNMGLLFVSINVTIAFTHIPMHISCVKSFFSFGYVYIKFNKHFKIKALCW